MVTAIAVAPPAELIRELIDLNNAVDPFLKMKTCSVVTYGESTLLKWPWSGLHRKNERGPTEVAVAKKDAAEGRWSATCLAGGLPGVYERAVFRALEWIAIGSMQAQGKPFRNPLIVHPREICERLCWRTTQPQFDAIENAMRLLCQVQIEDTACKQMASKRIGILRSVITGARRSSHSGAACPHLIVYFDRYFEETVNAGRIAPLNWGLWVALRDPVAQRLLEILESEFAGPGYPRSASFNGDALAGMIPISPSIPRLEQQMLVHQANATLLRKGYLSKVDIGAGGTLVYRAGPAVMAMRCHPEISRFSRVSP